MKLLTMKRECFQQKTLRRICTINVQGSLQNTASGHDATVKKERAQFNCPLPWKNKSLQCPQLYRPLCTQSRKERKYEKHVCQTRFYRK